MADFFQNGVITTLHRLRRDNEDLLISELKKFKPYSQVALVLPSLFSEFEGDAMPKIVDELATADYVDLIVLSLDRADEEGFRYVKRFLSKLPQEVVVIWNDGPRMQELYRKLWDEFGPWERGKGMAVWIGYGYALARRQFHTIASHDCDILTYKRELLTRLVYPIANPRLSFDFAKGYYARFTDKLNGRVMRIFLTPLLRALMNILGRIDFLVYLDSFRYPLSGEFAMTSELAIRLRIPSDWGIEIGILAEVYRLSTLGTICQVDIADVYDHKHQVIDPDDPKKGLLKMAVDIAKMLFRSLAGRGVVFSEGFFKTLKATYYTEALKMIRGYHNDALINSLKYNLHGEHMMVLAFSKAIDIAGEEILRDPMSLPIIPNWVNVISAMPDFFERLLDVVEEDKKI
ncbi:MAG: glycosyl transferase [Synergistetes bacterium]|nr:MAG: Uncharacterized protein XD52_0413 [bacterium 42_11]MBC7330806.1 glycosyl transferase [Synergistota bacterium]